MVAAGMMCVCENVFEKMINDSNRFMKELPFCCIYCPLPIVQKKSKKKVFKIKNIRNKNCPLFVPSVKFGRVHDFNSFAIC
jgi:hypothetical protein